MEFTISKTSLQKELGLVQGTVEKKNTIPALSNILIESVGEGTIRVTGTDLDVTLRCETEAEIKTPGSMCVGARKLFEIARVLPDAPVSFRKEENNWATVKCERSNFRIAGIDRDAFPEVDRKSTRLNSSHSSISYAVFCLKKKKKYDKIKKKGQNTKTLNQRIRPLKKA